MDMRRDADTIIKRALSASLPDTAVRKALEKLPKPEGRLVLVAIGKAAWQMAREAERCLGDQIDSGIVITKHGYSRGPVGSLLIREAGHPVPDAASYLATSEAMRLVGRLTEKDLVLFLVSGGGSALFEQPLVPHEEMDNLTQQLLGCGAGILEINTLRKRLSAVKGGKFARLCAPARVFSVLLSDVLGDAPDMIASGPAYPDSSTCAQALSIIEKYDLKLSPRAMTLMQLETPKALSNIETHITGSVRQLCAGAEAACNGLGYKTAVLTTTLGCEAREAGGFLASIARHYAGAPAPQAFIAGGETVVQITGDGLGGRNQELALAAARGIDGLKDVVVFSVGSDGTDGPTDAAGGIVDGGTAEKLRRAGIDIAAALRRNDSYHALKAVDSLVFTGPTGTNVNDFACILIR